jgi:hypothetical protein
MGVSSVASMLLWSTGTSNYEGMPKPGYKKAKEYLYTYRFMDVLNEQYDDTMKRDKPQS